MRPRPVPLLALLLWGVAAFTGCGSGGAQAGGADDATDAESEDGPPVEDDKSLCQWRGRNDVEVAESRGPGAKWENVRRVFTISGQGEERRRVLRCREIDTNLDGIKDVARWYDEFGKARSEQSDTNYDGKIDTKLQFAAGKVAHKEVDLDGDGRAEEIWFYSHGKLSRVQRDTDGDGKPDVWEIYDQGRLDRIGVDLNHDGHVDRWDRDEVARREAEKAESEDDTEKAPDVPGGKDANKEDGAKGEAGPKEGANAAAPSGSKAPEKAPASEGKSSAEGAEASPEPAPSEGPSNKASFEPQ